MSVEFDLQEFNKELIPYLKRSNRFKLHEDIIHKEDVRRWFVLDSNGNECGYLYFKWIFGGWSLIMRNNEGRKYINSIELLESLIE